MKTLFTIRFLANEEVFAESRPDNEFEDILLRPLKEKGYKLEKISSTFDDEICTYEISHPQLNH